MRGPVLALDLAREFGFASGEVGAKVPSKIGHGIFGGKRDAPTEKVFADAADVIARLILGHNLVVYESPLPPIFKRGFTNMAAARLCFGLAAICEAACYQLGVEVREARVADVRDHFIQTHRLKGKDGKREVFERCKLLGFEVETFDESDAGALWHYMCALIDPRTAARSTPLFARTER